MIKWALIFALISLIAGVLGFSGVAAGAAGIAKVLFVLCLVVFLVLIALAVAGVGALRRWLSHPPHAIQPPSPSPPSRPNTFPENTMSAKPTPLKRATRQSDLPEGAHALELDQAALDAARKNIGDGAVTPGYGPWRDSIVKLLNGALATELVCILRYKRHHFTAHGLASPAIAAEFMVHANEEAAHADLLAERIVQLGGKPDFSPDTLLARSHADYDESSDLKAMVRANLVAERVAVESYRQMIALIGDKDPTTRRLLEGILNDEEEHAEELSDMLEE